MINKNTKFLIVGLGLLGGAYAKALKKNGYIVNAVDINKDSIEYALENKIIDEGAVCDYETLIEKADVIISGLYPTTMVEWIKENQKYFKKSCIITDVSGVKRGIVDKVQEILSKDIEFISSHPMAGKEVSGVRNSDENIFKIANFIITPTEKNTDEGIKFVRELGEILGFRNITQLSLEEHDKMIGFVSQLTHVIAVSLMNTNDNTHLVEYTGDSFRDLTRIAKINEVLWSELFLLNKEVLVKEIDDFAAELNNFREKLVNEDTEGMKKLFIQSTERRKLFDKKDVKNRK
ncbi:prephenate dehydrogenase [Fusobacterium sp.]|uniref:prephenate dehydrogenase n=1 Tax=Fusobacterium sp. TaxID=68766 RepID=UPI0029039CF5|nr:prephenate dehydrogenase [Fusobacterium sp.]MDU1911033.1 prephenate dehydrogenase [Fusobacterium sp.]